MLFPRPHCCCHGVGPLALALVQPVSKTHWATRRLLLVVRLPRPCQLTSRQKNSYLHIYSPTVQMIFTIFFQVDRQHLRVSPTLLRGGVGRPLLGFIVVIFTTNVLIRMCLQASKKKRRCDFIPYRDSVLTWLLRENLGVYVWLSL